MEIQIYVLKYNDDNLKVRWGSTPCQNHVPRLAVLAVRWSMHACMHATSRMHGLID